MISPPIHFTCLCELFERKYVCCKKGYSNLIKSVPNFVVYSPNPEVINSYHIQNALNYLPGDKSILEILTFVFEQKIEVLENQKFLIIQNPDFKYGKK